MAVTINEGTQTSIKTTDSGGNIQHVRADGGTVGVVGAGTLNTLGTVGNLNFGTVDTFYRHPDRFATVVSSGTLDMGTIKPGVAGSSIYVTDLIISAGTTTNVMIGNGGTGLFLVGTLHFSTNGGAVMNFKTPISTSGGSSLVYKQSANGALTITATGYVD